MVYLDLSSNYGRALSLRIISCQEQLQLKAADDGQTGYSICTAVQMKNTHMKLGNQLQGLKSSLWTLVI